MNKLPERIRIKDIARLADVSVGTVDRVLHGRTGVSEASRKRVEEILKQLDYQPNMYASALASNKKYLFVCLLPQHKEGDYWTDVELGMKRAVETFSDFHITLSVMYYDQYEYSSFINAGEEILKQEPDGVLLAPTIPEMTARFTDKLQEREIPYIFIDSNVASLNPLAFFGQKSDQSGYFAARMAMMLGECPKEIVIFRQINEGRLGSNQQENREKGFRKYMQEHFDEIVEFSELHKFLDSPVKNFSSGMRARLGFSIATIVRPDILIVDEILAVGDYSFQQKCLKRMDEMMGGGTTLLFVSHSIDQVRKLCDHAVWINKGQIMQIGEVNEVCDAYMATQKK